MYTARTDVEVYLDIGYVGCQRRKQLHKVMRPTGCGLGAINNGELSVASTEQQDRQSTPQEERFYLRDGGAPKVEANRLDDAVEPLKSLAQHPAGNR